MSNLLKLRGNGQLTLPAAIRKQASIQEGDTFEVYIDDDGAIRLVPKVVIDRNQAYFWTKRWQDGERETDEDLSAGRFKDFDSIESLLEELEAD